MSYIVHALVAKRFTFSKLEQSLSGIHLTELPQDYCLLPLTDELSQRLQSKYSVATESTPRWLCPGLEQFATELSVHGAVAYIQAEYFEGVGQQGAVVWLQGRAVFGPLQTDSNSRIGLSQEAINRALRAIGVIRTEGHDEFETLGLGAHRSTETWAGV